jgi:hypothetical protein
MSFGIRISCQENTLVWNMNTFRFGKLRLAPLKIVNVVRHVCPLLTQILSEKYLFIYFAWFISKFSA